MIVIPLHSELLTELIAMSPCQDCDSGLALAADRVDQNGVVVPSGVVVTHSSDSCPALGAIPLGVTYFVFPDGQR